MKIETSKDVRKALTDEFCKEVITEKISPRFKEQQYYKGIDAGFNALIEKLAPEKTDQLRE